MTPRVVVTVLLLFLLCPQESTAGLRSKRSPVFPAKLDMIIAAARLFHGAIRDVATLTLAAGTGGAPVKRKRRSAGGVARFQATGATGSGCGLANIIGVAAPPKGRGPPTPPAFPGLRKK